MSNPPSKLFVQITFLGFNIALVVLFSLGPSMPETVRMSFMLVCGIFFFWYFFALGRYMYKLNRSGILWGGLSFLTSSLGGIWVSYLAMLFVGPVKVTSPSTQPESGIAVILFGCFIGLVAFAVGGLATADEGPESGLIWTFVIGLIATFIIIKGVRLIRGPASSNATAEPAITPPAKNPGA